jgi:hypothetical protein
MNWWNTIRKQEIRKTPYYRQGNKYYWMQLEDIPGLAKMFTRGNFPAEKFINRGMKAKAHLLDSNRWYPSISQRQHALLLVNILNTETGEREFPWAVGKIETEHSRATQREKNLAAGDTPFDLHPKDIGVAVILQDSHAGKGSNNYKCIINLYVPKDNELWEQIQSTVTLGSVPEDYDLTNGAAAALLIMTQMILKRGKNPVYKEQQAAFEEFGIGPLSRDTESKYIKELVDKGLFRREFQHGSPSMRGYPQPTNKGHGVSNRFEMKHGDFFGSFKAEVRANPDKKFKIQQFGGGASDFESEFA